MKCRYTCEMEAHIYVQMDFQVRRLIYQATLTKGIADQIETSLGMLHLSRILFGIGYSR